MIAEAQDGLWFVFYPVIGQLGFLAFVIASVAAENRVPFDILEAESELVAGFRVEYSGMKFALIQLGEYAHVLGTSFLGALLFLGAWAGPGPAWLGPVWFSREGAAHLPADHLGAVELRAHPRRPDPRHVLEAAAARDAAPRARDGWRRRLEGRWRCLTRGRGASSAKPACWRWRVFRAMRITVHQPLPQAGHGPLPGRRRAPIPTAIAACSP